jgi:hypothetical protein
MKIQNVCLLLLISFLSYGQDPECNQLTTGGKRKVPKDVCIPDGYNIREIFKCGDVNLDGLDDYAFTYTKIKPEDGDTTFLCIYYATSDSTFILKKIYTNLYPIIFGDYGYSDHNMKLPKKIKDILAIYHGNNPLNWIKFLDGKIKLSIIQAYNESLVLHFAYYTEKDDWLLTETEFNVEYDGQVKTTKTEYQGEEQMSIKDFNYFDWL